MMTAEIVYLNRRAEEIAREHPNDYHKLPEYQRIVDIRSELINERTKNETMPVFYASVNRVPGRVYGTV